MIKNRRFFVITGVLIFLVIWLFYASSNLFCYLKHGSQIEFSKENWQLSTRVTRDYNDLIEFYHLRQSMICDVINHANNTWKTKSIIVNFLDTESESLTAVQGLIRTIEIDSDLLEYQPCLKKLRVSEFLPHDCNCSSLNYGFIICPSGIITISFLFNMNDNYSGYIVIEPM